MEKRGKLYKTLIRPIVTYGPEAWTIKITDEQHLRVFERNIMRRIYVPVFIGGECNRRSNKDLEVETIPTVMRRLVKTFYEKAHCHPNEYSLYQT